MEVHQILPALSCHDAVSNDVIEIHKFLLEHGYSPRIYAKYIHSDVSKYASELHTYKGAPQNVVLYHFSLAGGDVTDYVKQLPDNKILIYHNITPSYFFDRYDTGLQILCYKGLEELKDHCNDFVLAVGDSEYNQSCLKQLGYKNTTVIPILIDFESWAKNTDLENLQRSYINVRINFLFVGRISPNKKYEDIVKVFFYYHTYINSNSKLFLVGNIQFPMYHSDLEELIRKLKLTGAVIFTGKVSEVELKHYYEMAHIFLCMSEHEGFCVPLLEAMHFRIPIIAYNSTGIPGTLGDTGILVNRKNYPEIAEIINILIEDDDIRDRIIQKQVERLMFYDKQRVGTKLIEIIEGLEDISIINTRNAQG